jgi:hypothetical protein
VYSWWDWMYLGWHCQRLVYHLEMI